MLLETLSLCKWFLTMNKQEFDKQYLGLVTQMAQTQTALSSEIAEILISFYKYHELKGYVTRSGSNFAFTLAKTPNQEYDRIEWNTNRKALLVISSDDRDHFVFKNLELPKEGELLDLKKNFEIRRNMNVSVLDEFFLLQDTRRAIIKWLCLKQFSPIKGHNFLLLIIKLFNLFVELQEDWEKNVEVVREPEAQ